MIIVSKERRDSPDGRRLCYSDNMITGCVLIIGLQINMRIAKISISVECSYFESNNEVIYFNYAGMLNYSKGLVVSNCSYGKTYMSASQKPSNSI